MGNSTSTKEEEILKRNQQITKKQSRSSATPSRPSPSVADMGICNSSTKHDVKQDRTRKNEQQQQGQQGQGQTQGQQQQHNQQQQGQQINNTSSDRSRGGQVSQGIPTGSYRDANGIPRSQAQDQPTHASSYKPEDGSAIYGTSYTNRKTQEYDLLNDIVKQTRHNFIDVSAKVGQLDEDDLLERGQKYVKNLNEIPSSQTHHQQQSGSAATASAQNFGTYYASMELPQPSSIVVKRVAASSHSSSTSSSLAAGLSHRLTGEIDYQALVLIMSTATISSADLDFITGASSQISTVLLDATVIQEPAPKIVLTFEELLNDK